MKVTKIGVVLCWLIIPHFLSAQEILPLYEQGKVPNSIPTDRPNDSLFTTSPYTGRDTLVVIPKTLMPTLTVYSPTPAKKTDIALVICSGGSYRGVVDWAEGTPAAKLFSNAGITCFLLHYRIPRSDLMPNKEIGPLQDLQQAIRYVREHASKYGLDSSSIGVMGFSAGGHLVSTAATHFDKARVENPLGTSLRPDFTVLVYPVISFVDSLTHLLSRKNLIGPEILPEKVQEYSNELQVTYSTPPAFIVHAIDDPVVKVTNSLLYSAALQAHSIATYLYLYNEGGHGFGIHTWSIQPQWTTLCAEWILQKKWKKGN